MKILFGILLFFTIQEASANMRRCLLLPIHYEKDESLSFKVFEELETYLRMGHWCYYQSNSAILEILAPYKSNLNQYLAKEEVLKIIAQKTNSGSLIKIELTPKDIGIELSMNVMGRNGTDIYISKNTTFKRANSHIISQMAKNWLEEYQQIIPYDGLIIDAFGDQFTIDVGSDYELYAGSEVSISRPEKRKRHPLLKEVVEYESTPIGEGEITKVTTNQGQGKIIFYEKKNFLQVGDWVKIKEHQKREFLKINKYKRENNYKFGKIGEWGISLPLGASDLKNISKKNNMAGLGIELSGELWITRKYWTGLSYSHKFGVLNHNGLDNDARLRFKIGYRHLLLDFFHGPQLSPFIGYGHYQYNLKASDSISFQGILLGLNCHLPLKNMFALNAELGFIPSTSYSESDSSGSSYHLETGFSYWYNPRSKFITSFDFVNNTASVENDSQTKVRETRLKMGFSFIF